MTIRLIHVHQLLTLYLTYGVKYQSGVIWGHLGQMVIKNTITHPCYIAWPQDSYKYISLRLSMLWGEMSIWGSFGVTGIKRSFSLKCYNSSVLHTMTIKLIYVHQLEIVYLCYGVKCQSWVIWVHWGQKVIFTKNAIGLIRPWYIAWP